MGLFSTKKKTVVNTSTSRLIEDKDIPDVNKTALMDYMFYDKSNRNNTINTDKSLTDFIALNNANSIGTSLRSSRIWASNKYAYGVPEGDILNKSEIDLVNVMDEYLTTQLGQQLRIGYAKMQPLNALHFAWYLLAKEHHYDTDTNQFTDLTAAKGTPVYLKDIQINYCSNTLRDLVDADTLAQYGTPATYGKTATRLESLKRTHTPYVENTAATHDYALISYCYIQGAVEQVGTFQIDFLDYEYSGSDPDNDMPEDANEQIEPDAVTPIVSDNRIERDYYMVEYFVQQGATEQRKYFIYEFGSNGRTELDRLFITNKVMGKHYPNIYFRLMGTKLSADVYKDTDEYKSSVQYARRLNLNWSEISDQLHESIGSIGDVTQMLLSCQLSVNAEDELIQRYMYDYFYGLYNQMPRIMASSAYSNVNSEYINGYAKAGQTIQIKDKVYANRIAFNAIGYVDSQETIGTVGTVKMQRNQLLTKGTSALSPPISIHVHQFIKQITATTCRTISIYGLTSTQEVTGGYTTTASNEAMDLLIPLDETIVNKFPIKERNLLYSKSLVFIINTTKVIKTKWYQSGVFKVIMFIAAVVLSIWTGGQSLTIYTVLYAVAQAVVISVALKIVIRFLVNKLGLDLGGLFAVIAIILIAYGGAALLSNAGKIMSMTATQFMQLANYAIQVSSMSNQLTMQKMQKAHAAYYDLMQEKFDELETLEDDLKADQIVNPAYLLADSIRGPDIRIESMNTFLVRTLSVDMGLATLDTIPNMVALTVQLPTFEQLYAKYAQQRGLL